MIFIGDSEGQLSLFDRLLAVSRSARRYPGLTLYSSHCLRCKKKEEYPTLEMFVNLSTIDNTPTSPRTKLT